ncbi:MAG: uroporphyrinogen-III synthase [Campylobacterales bacterium]|nr:uroporphyrinogen-III synthase [Campylobacterales bacterium]
MEIFVLNDRRYENAKNLPIIEIEFLDVEIDFERVDIIIFTSQNSVKSLQKYLQKWQHIPALAVGEATKECLIKLHANVINFDNSFYGDDLVLNSFELLKNKNILYPRAKKVSSNISTILKSFDLIEVIVYQTICKKIEQKEIKNSKIIFSSPSTVECFFKNFSFDSSNVAISIGKKTSNSLKKYLNDFKEYEYLTIQEIIELEKSFL